MLVQNDLVDHLKVLIQNQFLDIWKAFKGECDFKFPYYQTSQIELSEQHMDRIAKHFFNNCNDMTVLEVPSKKRKRSPLSANM